MLPMGNNRLGTTKRASRSAEHVVYAITKGGKNRDCGQCDENQQERIFDEVLAFFLLHEVFEELNHGGPPPKGVIPKLSPSRGMHFMLFLGSFGGWKGARS